MGRMYSGTWSDNWVETQQGLFKDGRHNSFLAFQATLSLDDIHICNHIPSPQWRIFLCFTDFSFYLLTYVEAWSCGFWSIFWKWYLQSFPSLSLFPIPSPQLLFFHYTDCFLQYLCITTYCSSSSSVALLCCTHHHVPTPQTSSTNHNPLLFLYKHFHSLHSLSFSILWQPLLLVWYGPWLAIHVFQAVFFHICFVPSWFPFFTCSSRLSCLFQWWVYYYCFFHSCACWLLSEYCAQVTIVNSHQSHHVTCQPNVRGPHKHNLAVPLWVFLVGLSRSIASFVLYYDMAPSPLDYAQLLPLF